MLHVLPSSGQWRKPRTPYRCPGPRTKPERLQIRSNYGKDFSPWIAKMNFIPPYDYLLVSTRKYRHIVLRGTHYEKLKSYQFFFEGSIKWLASKFFENKTYVRANVLPSMKKTPYRAVLEFSLTCNVLRAACTYPAGLGLQERENAITLEECCLLLRIL